jgi:hypothetical protein
MNENKALKSLVGENPRNTVYWATLKIPLNKGHFWSTFTLPSGLEEAMVGPFGGYAYKLYDHTEEHATYAYESFGELFDPNVYPGLNEVNGYREATIPFVPKMDDLPLPDFSPSPALGNMKELQDILPSEMSFGSDVVTMRGIKPTSNSKAHMSYEVHWLGKEFAVAAEYTIFARSPIVRISGVARSLDMKAKSVNFSIKLNEEFQWVNTNGRNDLQPFVVQDDFTGKWTGGQAVHFDTGSLFPFQFQIFAQVDHGEIDTLLQDLHSDAISAARECQGFFRGMVTEWPGLWFGEEVIKHWSYDDGYKAWKYAWNTYETNFLSRRPWASEIRAGQGGTQNSFGPIFTVPIFSNPRPLNLDFLEYCAEDWALRPVHVFEPGTVMTPISLSRSGVTTNNRQIHYASHDLVYPYFRPEGKSELVGRTGHDDEHYADAPLQTAYALAPSYALKVVMVNHMHLDLHQRRVKSGWSHNGRGIGRVITGMINNSICLPEYRQDVWEHVAKITDILNNKWAGKDMPTDSPVRVIYPLTDPRIQCQQPAWSPWEEAQAAYSFMRAYDVFGGKQYLMWAFTLGRANNHASWQELDKWWKPYRVYTNPDGKSLQDQLSISSPLVHFGGVWIWWSVIADKVFMRANSVLNEATQEEVDRSQKVLAFIRESFPSDFVDAHMSLESRPVPPIAE